MPQQIFNDNFFANEPNCTRVTWDNNDGTANYNSLKVYRFGDKSKDYDWLSPNRQAKKGNFARPKDYILNDRALSQVRFGRKGQVGADTPFISVATSYKELYKHGEPWVQSILAKSPNLGVFVVPFETLMRPSINSDATMKETEWLYYDGDHAIIDFLFEWIEVTPALFVF